jgi:hypothetical protein
MNLEAGCLDLGTWSVKACKHRAPFTRYAAFLAGAKWRTQRLLRNKISDTDVVMASISYTDLRREEI